MRYLAGCAIGICISVFWLHPVTRETPVLLELPGNVGSAMSSVVSLKCLVVETTPGKFPDAMVKIFHDLFPIDLDSWAYHEPDSGNTTFWSLTLWNSDDTVLLIETYAGYAGGSCGQSIVVAKYDVDSASWQAILHDCGSVDTVHNISHNGMFDFTVRYRWSPPSRYIYSGKEYFPIEQKIVLTDSQQVARILGKKEGYGEWFDFSFEMEYVVLDSGKCAYIIANESAMEKCLIHEESPGVFRLINVFENAVQIDILKKHHFGMPNIRTVCWNMNNVYYQWNGSEYIEYFREVWHCPA